MIRPLHLLIAVACTMAAMVMSGCQSPYGHVVEPPSSRYSPAMFGEVAPDKAYISSAFIEFFNTETEQNEFRVRDWPGTEVFRLRLPGVEVGDGTVTYKSGSRLPPDNRKSLKATCTFADAAESRRINNGDTVDLEGMVAVAERGGLRIVVELEDCYPIEYENQAGAS